ncbi:NYN domain-containing protein [Agromyces archimandritae]|uniref:NYN domain-containing protein n=1 Tax=Agromyces archimandritae TaxID=2781962 RepID=A0A975FM44_9MICO|nr:NYN domain-containing protein [Agromyces archimandritae]QTX03496.1 NYN domain-containing protein [Agromyces archimandritae]
MTASTADARVAIYIDFDNIVISRYDQLHGRDRWRRDNARGWSPASADDDAQLDDRVDAATVDVGAILDFATSFGPLAISRAYADWSVPVNASYRNQLIDRAVDLVQLFPVVASFKNGADIRLSIDVVEDLFRLDDLTHVVIVAGDSDYIALAQRARLLGRYVVGVGVAGSTSRALAAACDEFADYDALPGVTRRASAQAEAAASPAVDAASTPAGKRRRSRKKPTPDESAADLLARALELLASKNDEDWQPSGAVKNQMLRMDPSFQERALGYSSFSAFVKAQHALVELDETRDARPIRLKP